MFIDDYIAPGQVYEVVAIDGNEIFSVYGSVPALDERQSFMQNVIFVEPDFVYYAII